MTRSDAPSDTGGISMIDVALLRSSIAPVDFQTRTGRVCTEALSMYRPLVYLSHLAPLRSCTHP
jgi:hypothetical protein